MWNGEENMGKQLTQEEFIEKLKDKNPNLELIGQYTKMKDKVKVKCINCGYEMEVMADNLINIHRKSKLCPNCSDGRRKISSEKEYIEILKEITESRISLIDVYKGQNTKIKHKCNVCGYEWNVLPRHLIERKNHSECPNCANILKKTTSQYKNEVEKLNSNIVVVGEYVNNKTNVLHKCKLCNYTWESTPHNILNGKTSCPHCKKSHGERFIINYLDNHRIKYFAQYKFDNCKNQRPLPFDFYLPDYNICIEYDGIGHYQPTRWNGCNNDKCNMVYQNTINNDNIKNEYCNNEHIKLIRIPYWEFDNIEEILNRELEVV